MPVNLSSSRITVAPKFGCYGQRNRLKRLSWLCCIIVIVQDKEGQFLMFFNWFCIFWWIIPTFQINFVVDPCWTWDFVAHFLYLNSCVNICKKRCIASNLLDNFWLALASICGFAQCLCEKRIFCLWISLTKQFKTMGSSIHLQNLL